MSRIIYDVAGDVAPEDSVLEYSDEMNEFRATVTKEWEEYRAEHPDAELHAPEDLPSANIPVDE